MLSETIQQSESSQLLQALRPRITVPEVRSVLLVEIAKAWRNAKCYPAGAASDSGTLVVLSAAAVSATSKGGNTFRHVNSNRLEANSIWYTEWFARKCTMLCAPSNVLSTIQATSSTSGRETAHQLTEQLLSELEHADMVIWPN